MKKSKFYPLVFLTVFLFLSASCNNSCSVQSIGNESAAASVKVLSWNLQTFFDSNFDGIEYSEYANSSSG